MLSHEQQPESEHGRGSGEATRGRAEEHSREAVAYPGADPVDEARNPDRRGVGRGGHLDKVGDGELPSEEVDDEAEQQAEIVEHVAQRVARREIKRTLTRYSGPVPPAAEFGAYDAVLPGAADRILSMAEKALEAQIEVDTTLAHGDVKSVGRGQWQSSVIVGGTVVCALVSVILKAPWEATAVIMGPGLFEFGSSLVRAIREPKKTDDDSETSLSM